LSTPSIGPSYGFPLLKIIISRNIYRMGTLIVISAYLTALIFIQLILLWRLNNEEGTEGKFNFEKIL
jgi:hypothetical protein